MSRIKKVRVTDVKSNEILFEGSQSKCDQILGISNGTTSVYVKSGRIYKDKWKFDVLERERKIECYDLKTGEVLETFEGYSQASVGVGGPWTSYSWIKMVCLGEKKSYKGKGFRYAD